MQKFKKYHALMLYTVILILSSVLLFNYNIIYFKAENMSVTLGITAYIDDNILEQRDEILNIDAIVEDARNRGILE